LIGGKFRDRVLCYADTPSCESPNEMGERLLERRERGYKWLKMDVGIDLLWEVPGALISPPAARDDKATMHPFTGIQVTGRGVEHLVDYVSTVRAAAGYDVPLAVDHLGHIGLGSCLRLGQAFEPFTLAWLEDLVPWQLTDQWMQLTAHINTPTCTGEDIYLKENFRPLLEHAAVRVVHPDPATAGGIVETKRIGDLAQEHGVPMALHMAASPIATMAGVHIGAATENFLVLEHHAADVAHWDELVTGLGTPLVQDGYISVPDAPGLGFEDINEEVFRQFLDPSDPNLFEGTSSWDAELSHDRLWS
jgi:L-alanine-DL-glutamate epimerase-like enolase superfamily enzyme